MNLFSKTLKNEIDVLDLKNYQIALKCELLKLNNIKSLIIILVITLISVVFTYFANTINIEENILVLNSDKLIFDVHLKIFLFISFPLINVIIASSLYKIEYINNTKRMIYTLPIKKSTFYYSKLSIVILYNFVSLFFLCIFIIALRQYYMSAFGVHFSFTLEAFIYMIFSCLIVLVASIPISALHLWFGSLKLSSLLNTLILLGLTASSAFLYIKQLPNQWYNIYLFPLSAQKNFSKENFNLFSSSNWKWFSQDSFGFIIIMVLISSLALITSIGYYINNKDSKY